MAEKIKSLSKRLQLLKLIYQKQCTKKNIVALLVVKNHYSRSPCSRLFGNQGEVQDEDFHNSMTSSGYRPPSVQMLDGPSPACFEDETFFFPFFSNQIYHTGMCAYMSTEQFKIVRHYSPISLKPLKYLILNGKLSCQSFIKIASIKQTKNDAETKVKLSKSKD